MRVIALALTILFASQVGCSWTFVQAPPAGDPLPGQPVDCTDSNVFPALDFVGAGTFGVAAFFTLIFGAFFAAVGEEEPAQALLLTGVGTGVASGLYLWSGFDGAIDTSRCKELRLKSQYGVPGPLR